MLWQFETELPPNKHGLDAEAIIRDSPGSCWRAQRGGHHAGDGPNRIAARLKRTLCAILGVSSSKGRWTGHLCRAPKRQREHPRLCHSDGRCFQGASRRRSEGEWHGERLCGLQACQPDSSPGGPGYYLDCRVIRERERERRWSERWGSWRKSLGIRSQRATSLKRAVVGATRRTRPTACSKKMRTPVLYGSGTVAIEWDLWGRRPPEVRRAIRREFDVQSESRRWTECPGERVEAKTPGSFQDLYFQEPCWRRRQEDLHRHAQVTHQVRQVRPGKALGPKNVKGSQMRMLRTEPKAPEGAPCLGSPDFSVRPWKRVRQCFARDMISKSSPWVVFWGKQRRWLGPRCAVLWHCDTARVRSGRYSSTVWFGRRRSVETFADSVAWTWTRSCMERSKGTGKRCGRRGTGDWSSRSTAEHRRHSWSFGRENVPLLQSSCWKA